MEFFKKLTGNTPEVKRAIEERKALIRTEGASISDRIKEDSERQKTAAGREHAERMSAVDQRIAGGMKEIAKNRDQFFLDQVFRGLDRNLKSSLTMVLVSADISDYKAAMTEMMSEIEAKVEEVRENLTFQSMQSLETWAVSKAGNNGRVSEKVAKTLQEFRTELQKRGVSLE